MKNDDLERKAKSMRWAIYIWFVLWTAAWFALQFAKLNEQRAEYATKSMLEMMKQHPVFIPPVVQKEGN